MLNLGAAMAGGNGRNHHPDDFYPTPFDAVEALLAETGQFMGRTVHEPACGDGAISRVLELHGYDVISTDLIYRGYGLGGMDFLAHAPVADTIVTNPPFKYAAEFVRHAMAHKPRYLALLLKSNFWNARIRLPLFNIAPPRQILPLTWRLDFTGGGAPTMDCTWFVWGDFEPSQPFRPLPKPTKTLSEMML